MNYGIPEENLLQITSCIKKFPNIKWVKIYGSRAIGNYKKGSDIDLAFSSHEDISASFLSALDNLPTPYLFDVTHYESILNRNLKHHIDRVGKLIYSRYHI